MSTRTNIGKVTPLVKGTYNSAVPYERLDMVVSGGVSYIAKKNVPAGVEPPQGTYWMPMLDNEDATAAAAAAAINANEAAENAHGATSCVNTVAKPFDATEDYPAGDYVIRSAKMYEFIKPHTAGNWDAAEVQETTAGNEAFEIKKGLSSSVQKDSFLQLIKYRDAIIADNNLNCSFGGIQNDGTYNQSRYRLHSTTLYPVPSVKNFRLIVKTFGLRTGVCLNFWGANGDYIRTTNAYYYDGDSIGITTSGGTFAGATHFTLQFTADDEYMMDPDWLARNPVILLRECSDIEPIFDKIIYRGYIDDSMERGDFFPKDKRYWRIGGTTDISKSIYYETLTTSRLTCLIPFNLRSFEVVWGGPSGKQYYFYLLDKDMNVVGWTYGYNWRDVSYQHQHEGDDVAYMALSIRYTNNAAMTLDDLDNVDLQIRPLEVSSSDTVPFRMKVMSYNVGHWCYGLGSSIDDCGIPAADYNTQVPKLKNFWMKYKPDILSMCEYYKWLDHEKTHLSSDVLFNWLYAYNFRTDTQNALFSNHELLNRTKGYLSESPRRKEFLLTEIHSHGVVIAVFAYHGPLEEIYIQTELAAIVSKLNSYDYAIVCGDFNTENYNVLTSAGFKKANGEYVGPYNTWHIDNPSMAIDNILVKGKINILNFEVLYDEVNDLCSDHVPVIADLEIY